jgi:hypothetical protein
MGEDIHIPKVQGCTQLDVWPNWWIQAHGNWLKVTSYNRAISIAMCSHELNPQSLLCTMNFVQHIHIFNFEIFNTLFHLLSQIDMLCKNHCQNKNLERFPLNPNIHNLQWI